MGAHQRELGWAPPIRARTKASGQANTFPEPDNALQGRRTYLLSASQIRSLKHRISLHGKGTDGDTAPAAAVTPPSTYAAVASLVWTSGVRAKNALSDAAADAYLMFAADCRARLRPPLPAAFFGNCAKSCYARATVGALRDARGREALARAAAAVREAVREQLADPLGDAERWLERHRALPPGRVVQVGASNRFAAYETDFGWGRPARVELASVFVREFVAVSGRRTAPCRCPWRLIGTAWTASRPTSCRCRRILHDSVTRVILPLFLYVRD
ncbi:hypothetical protein C2845_PM09G02550 [Panicum miliaceum]|uniref:Uncharacterized protein n=1 Tax=Panicum miliaceum TaxID=4540 RepID=A0A3L6RWJ2_PANMI|nr:hypothetical protein C2845_PM09G02550 [Panicum miliaceum]